jgi:phage gp46-like protein
VLALRWDDAEGHAQLVEGDAGLVEDYGLETSVLVSLFTDRRVSEVEAERVPGGDRRGWWADSESLRLEGDASPVIGSRLWLLQGRPFTDAAPVVAEEYIREALAWMVEAGAVGKIDVTAVVLSPRRLGLGVTLYRPRDDKSIAFRKLWEMTV